MSQHQTLSRDLSLFDVTMIGVGAMIGAGIFVLTGEAAGTAGPALILAFALNGIVTIFTAMVYAELGSAIPEAGGGYLWVKEGLPGANAFLAGWMSWFAHAVAGALYALGFGAFLYELLKFFGLPLFGMDLTLSKKVLGLGIVLIFVYINYRGASETGLAGNIVTVAKIVVIGIFCFFGLKFMFAPEMFWDWSRGQGGFGTSQLQPFIPEETGWLGIFSAMGLTFIAFEGYEIIVQAGEEVKDPRRNIPKAVFWSLAIVIPIYMLVAFVLLGATNTGQLVQAIQNAGQTLSEGLSVQSPNWKVLKEVGELGLARAASQFLPYGTILILSGGLLSTMSALNATTFSSTRVAFAMGRDKNLPDRFGAISETTRTPYFALVCSGVLMGGMVMFVPITTVAAAADIMFLLLFLQVNVAVITLRKKYGERLAYGYLMPFFPAVPVIGIIMELALALFMFHHYPLAWFYVIGWLMVGFLLYRFYAAGREREKRSPPVLLHEQHMDVKPSSVLIPVSSAEDARDQIQLGARIARRLDSELILLHTVRVPRQLPQRAARRFISPGKEVLKKHREYAEELDVAVTTMLRTSNSVAKAISFTAEETGADFLLMGWKGLLETGTSLIGSNIDRVLVESNTHAIIVQTDEGIDCKRVLVPVADPKRAALAMAVAAILTENSPTCRITILHVTAEPLTDAEKEEFQQQLESFAEESEEGPESLFHSMSPFRVEFAVADNAVFEIAKRSENFDRVIIGVTRGSFFGRTILGRIPRLVARRSRCPVILVRTREAGFRFEVQKFFQFFRELELEPKEEKEAHEEQGDDEAEDDHEGSSR